MGQRKNPAEKNAEAASFSSPQRPIHDQKRPLFDASWPFINMVNDARVSA
jgi:hypothetical protein